jgi:hypothetical protein
VCLGSLGCFISKFLCVSLLDAIACALCAFPRRRHQCRHLHFVFLFRKTTSTITYTLCTSRKKQRQCHHHQHSIVDSSCMSMHCLLPTPIYECLGCHHQNLLMLLFQGWIHGRVDQFWNNTIHFSIT